MTKFQLHSLKRSKKYNNIMNLKEKIKKIFQPKLKLLPGTRLTSFLFIGASILIAGAILFAANIYYNLDTGEIVMEEIQRVTQLIRATAGLVVGGTSTTNLPSGVALEIATTSAVRLSGANQELRFTGGTSYYVGFKATTTLSTTTVYTWPANYPPSSDYYLTSDNEGNMFWKSLAAAGLGDITAVGDCASGDCFTSTGTSGTSLWFYDPDGRGQLTIANLTQPRTYILPDLSGTITLSSGALGSNRVLFSDNGLISTSSAFQWDNTSRILTLGETGSSAQLRIYSSSASGYYLGFAASSGMTTSTIYYWPIDYGTNNYVLTTDGAGNLSWKSVSGAGGVDTFGLPQPNQVAFFYDGDTITGSSNFTFSTTTNTLTIGGTIVANSFTGPSGATTTLSSASGQNILIDPATGKVILGTGDWIETSQGYQIGKSGTQVLREMVPIFGFDLPVKTSTTTAAKISRDIVSYPLNPCEPGSTRVHKLVVRYGSTGTSTIAIATSTAGDYSSATLAPTGATSTGSVATVQLSIPTPADSCTTWTQGTDTTDWWVTIRLNQASTEIMIYQIFLAGYDEIL
jgi:hypothetical protein